MPHKHRLKNIQKNSSKVYLATFIKEYVPCQVDLSNKRNVGLTSKIN